MLQLIQRTKENQRLSTVMQRESDYIIYIYYILNDGLTNEYQLNRVIDEWEKNKQIITT